jgi:hypothetical protein
MYTNPAKMQCYASKPVQSSSPPPIRVPASSRPPTINISLLRRPNAPPQPRIYLHRRPRRTHLHRPRALRVLVHRRYLRHALRLVRVPLIRIGGRLVRIRLPAGPAPEQESGDEEEEGQAAERGA